MSDSPSAAELLADLVALPGPPGQEDTVRDYISRTLENLGVAHRVDAKGNLLASTGATLPDHPTIVVTAHMDEIALMVTGSDYGGTLRVSAQGGVHPWKWGEGAVEVLPLDGREPVTGILGFGSIHTSSPLAPAQNARDGKSITWADASLFTGRTTAQLREVGIVPGCRVVMARDRRKVVALGGDCVASYFLDDRADCVAAILALAQMKKSESGTDILFVFSAAEEVGGEGALFALRSLSAPPAVCVALEIGPIAPDNRLVLDATPTVWLSDGFATMPPDEIANVYAAASDAGIGVQPHALSRGGSDATIAASHGLCAHPVTLAFAADNSHGFEIMHRNAPENLAKLLVAYLDYRNKTKSGRE